MQLAESRLFFAARASLISPFLLAMTCLTSACRGFYLLATTAFTLLNAWDIWPEIYFHNPSKFIVYGQKKDRKRICGIGMLRQQQLMRLLAQMGFVFFCSSHLYCSVSVLPYADTAIASDLVSAFGPLLYGPHSY